MAVWADLGRSATRIGHVPVVVTQRSSARYRHWPFRCCYAARKGSGTNQTDVRRSSPHSRRAERMSHADLR
jgi:hypothetical protein